MANRFYRGVTADLVLLVIDTGRLAAPLRYDDVPSVGMRFPHIYGPLNPDAVLRAVPLAPGPDGGFAFEPPPG